MVAVVAATTVIAGCSADEADWAEVTSSVPAPATVVPDEQRYPDIVDATVSPTDGGWRFDVTVSSPYDTPERYADAWRIVGPDGTVYGIRELTHDHAAEQPFTRSLDGVSIPDDVTSVTIEGRDQRYGWGGATVDVVLAR